MPNLDNVQFNELLSQGKYDEAKALLKTFINSEWTKEDQGEYYVNLVEEYIELSNNINKAYITELLQIKKSLEELDNIESEVDKSFELKRIRDEISNL